MDTVGVVSCVGVEIYLSWALDSVAFAVFYSALLEGLWLFARDVVVCGGNRCWLLWLDVCCFILRDGTASGDM